MIQDCDPLNVKNEIVIVENILCLVTIVVWDIDEIDISHEPMEYTCRTLEEFEELNKIPF